MDFSRKLHKFKEKKDFKCDARFNNTLGPSEMMEHCVGLRQRIKEMNDLSSGEPQLIDRNFLEAELHV